MMLRLKQQAMAELNMSKNNTTISKIENLSYQPFSIQDVSQVSERL